MSTPIEEVKEAANAVLIVNQNFGAARGAFVGAQHEKESSDLSFALYGGPWGNLTVVDDTLTLTDNVANYIVLEISSGDFSVSTATTNWNLSGTYRRCLKVTPVSGVVPPNNVEDFRFGPGGLLNGSGGAGTGIVETIVGGDGITVDSTDPINPVINAVPICIPIACSDETTDLVATPGIVTFRMPFAMTGVQVRASLTGAPTGSALQVDINEAGSSILSTKLTIDASEKTSTTAATPAVVSDSSLADDAEITIDLDSVGSSSPGKGLKVYIIGIPS